MPIFILFLIFGVILSLYILWSRRKYYLFAIKCGGPKGLPFIGVLHKFRTLDDLLSGFLQMSNELKLDTGFGWAGPYPFLATKDPIFVEKILTSPDCLNKPIVYDGFIDAIGAGLLTIGEPKCTSHRKMLNPAFKHNILVTFFPIFNDGTNFLLKDFEKLVGTGELDLINVLYGYTLRISIETTLGMDGNKYRERSVKLVPHTKTVIAATMNRLIRPWLRYNFLFRVTSFYKPYMEAKATVDDFIKEIIAENIEARNKAQDILKDIDTDDSFGDSINIKSVKNFMKQALDLYSSKQFHSDDLFGETSSMLYSAFETTATTLNNVLIMLAMHPNYQETLFEEILSVFPEKDFEVNYDDFSKLPYLDMVINETLRVVATVPLISRSAGSDIYITDELTVPKGTQCIIDIFNMHRNPAIWGPNATIFNPDNFLPENLTNKHPFAFIPFSKGTRGCIGWHYAKMLLKVPLARVLRNYRLSTKFPFEDLHYSVYLTTKFKEAPKLKVNKR